MPEDRPEVTVPPTPPAAAGGTGGDDTEDERQQGRPGLAWGQQSSMAPPAE
jgi:hypothetical protein